MVRGILDTYRREQAVADQQAPEAKPGADDSPCPVECVKDIYNGEDNMHAFLLSAACKFCQSPCHFCNMNAYDVY